jgi:hypothetical protein
MAAAIKGTGDEGFFSLIPRFILAGLFNLAIKEDEGRATDDKVSLKALIAAMYHDLKIVQDGKELLEPKFCSRNDCWGYPVKLNGSSALLINENRPSLEKS